MICHLHPRGAITHHSHCILSSCGMTKTGLIMLRSYKFRIEGSGSWQAMSRAMNLELRELAVSACYAPSTPAGLSHRGTLAESSKNTFLARVALQGLSETSGPKPEGPESCLSPSLRELKPQTACLDLCECGQFLDLHEVWFPYSLIPKICIGHLLRVMDSSGHWGHIRSCGVLILEGETDYKQRK